MAFFVFIVIYFSSLPWMKPIFTLATSAILGIALWEFYRIAKKNGYAPLSGLAIVGTIGYLYAIQLADEKVAPAALADIVLLLVLALGFIYFFFFGDRPLENLSVTYFGLVYLTLPLSMILKINFDFGRTALFFLILVTKLTDIGGYFIGKRWGRTQLAPYISPNKTWEGAIGGFGVGVLTSLAFIPFLTLPPGAILLLGAVLAIASIFGDLTESLLKRDLGVKDSSRLPGVGGFLDLVDSLVFTTPLLYFYLKFVSPL